MNNIYRIDTTLDIPIYRQLVDAIRSAIKNGTLASGHRLPTVNEMTSTLNIARGTVKRVYDELERAELIEKVQGRGTFVCYHPANSGSRKEQAMEAIDNMLDQLENMGLSPAEINIFLNLKLRERSEQEAKVKIAVVECNPENLSQMSEQLRHIDGVDIYSYLTESIKQYPYKLGEEFDLVVTSPQHASYLESIVGQGRKVARVALRLSARCLSDIIKLKAGTSVGIIGYSKRFAELLQESALMYNEDIRIDQPLKDSEDASEYIKDKDVILIPKLYEKHFGSETLDAVHSFRGDVINCYYEMDEGSILYLETKIKRLLDEKTI